MGFSPVSGHVFLKAGWGLIEGNLCLNFHIRMEDQELEKKGWEHLEESLWQFTIFYNMFTSFCIMLHHFTSGCSLDNKINKSFLLVSSYLWVCNLKPRRFCTPNALRAALMQEWVCRGNQNLNDLNGWSLYMVGGLVAIFYFPIYWE